MEDSLSPSKWKSEVSVENLSLSINENSSMNLAVPVMRNFTGLVGQEVALQTIREQGQESQAS